MVLTTARDCKVLALFITTPAHLHATSVAVSPALSFKTKILPLDYACNYGKIKNRTTFERAKSMKMLTNLHKIYSEW